MDNKITIRFFVVTRTRESDPSMRALLERIGGIPRLADREATLPGSMHVRLERLHEDGPDALAGEVTRFSPRICPQRFTQRGLERSASKIL
jgi:hypothetical protein